MSTEIGFGIVGAGMVARSTHAPSRRRLAPGSRPSECDWASPCSGGPTPPAARSTTPSGRASSEISCWEPQTVPYFRPQSYYDSAAWRGTWSLDGGGALMNQGIHLVDLFLRLMGGEAEVVGASGGVAQHEIEVEDCVVAALRFSSGARGTIAATTAAAPGFPHRVEVYGSRGGAQIEGDALVRWEAHPEGGGENAPRLASRSGDIRPLAPAAVAAAGPCRHRTGPMPDSTPVIRESRDLGW